MKKALALILALLMLCSTMVVFTSAGASNEIDMKALYEKNGTPIIYVGKALAANDAKPVQDGVVTAGEYQAKYVVASGSKDSFDGSNGGQTTSGGVAYTEYIAHDEEYLYFAATFQESVWDKVYRWSILRSNSYTFNYDPTVAHASMFTQNNGATLRTSTLTFDPRYTAPSVNGDATGVKHHQTSEEVKSVWNDGTNIKFATTIDANNLKTYEYRISKAWLAPLLGVSKASDIRNLAWTAWSHGMGRYFVHEFTDADKAELEKVNGAYTHSDDSFFRFFILDDGLVNDNSSLDLNKFSEANGYASTYVGKELSAEAPKPVQDGVVNPGEYQASYTIYTTSRDCVANNDGGYTTESGYDYVEYYAHDAEYLYFAATYYQPDMDRVFWWVIQKSNSYVYDYASGSFKKPADLTLGPRHTTETTYSLYNTSAEAEAAIGTNIFFTMTQKDSIKTYEFKVSKAWLATQIGAKSAADVRNLSWYTWCHKMGGGGRYMMRELSTVDKTALKSLGFEFTATNDTMGRFIILDEAPENRASDAFWQNYTEDLGLNIHVQPVTTAPVLDGVISANEYPTTRTTPLANLSAGNGNGELQGENVVEYFGHDGEYIYYAAVYTRKTVGNAFWPRIKMENSCNIYNNTHNKHVAVQLRLSDVLHTYQNGLAAYGSYTTPTFASAVSYTAADFIAQAGRVGDVETFEVKIAKSYIANANGITNDDVKVVPYYTYFHAATAVGSVITADQANAIKAAGGLAPTVGGISYTFMILDGETTKIEDRIEINTIDAASVRISPTNPGLRFKSTVNRTDLVTLIAKFGAENVQIGTLIAPADLVEGTLTHASASYIDVKATVDTPFGTSGADTIFAGSISNIKPANLERDFTAVGYICINGTYIYSATSCTRDVTEIVNAALADEAENPGTYSDYLLGILNTMLTPAN